MAPIGSKAVLKTRSTTVTRDELFSLEESLPQASFVAALNQRYVSVKQGESLVELLLYISNPFQRVRSFVCTYKSGNNCTLTYVTLYL